MKQIVIFFISLVIFSNAHAQEKAYWQGASIKNPALIATASDWIFGSYHFINSDNNLNGFILGADFKLSDKTGLMGVNYIREKTDIELVSLAELNYAIPVITSKWGKLNLGLAFGLRKNAIDFGSYKLYEDQVNDPGFEAEDVKIKFMKTSVGFFMN